MKNFKFFFLVLSFLSIFSACTVKDKFSYSGKVNGFVGGENAEYIYGPIDSAEVKFDRGDVIFTALTDETGNFSFANVPYGTYNISILKDSYAPVHILGHQLYFTDSVKYEMYYYMEKNSPVTIIENVKFYSDDQNIYSEPDEPEYWISFDSDADVRNSFIIFFSEDENVSYKNYQKMEYIDWYPNNTQWSTNLERIYTPLGKFSTINYAIYPCGYDQGPSHDFDWLEIETMQLFEVSFNTDIFYKGSIKFQDMIIL